MHDELKQRIHTLVDSIPDEAKLQMLMEDVQRYLMETGEGEGDLTDEETDAIDEATAEFDRGEYVSAKDLEKTMENETKDKV